MTASLPFFSVIVPTYNRPERLTACLEALAELDYDRDRYEVIAVDDGSSTDLSPCLEPVRDRMEVKLIRQENTGPAGARNRGVAEAQGEFIAFTDDDCMPLPDWLRQFAAALTQAPDKMVGGYTINALADNLYSTASQQLLDYLYRYYNIEAESVKFFASNNIAMGRDRFLNIGGFDTSFPLAAAEDREFCDRWLYKGLTMQYVPAAQIRHAHHMSLQSFWKQHFGYGRGAFCFHQVRAKRDEQPIKVEPWKFYADLLSYPLKQETQHSGVALSGLFFVSQVANATGFFWERFLGQNS